MAQERLRAVLTDTHPSVRERVGFLLETPGKRLRPALVLLSARAACGGSKRPFVPTHPAVTMAAAVEIIHMASLVHDDLVDDAAVRHHRPSVHVRWNQQTAVRLGDYLCAKAFQLVADCADPRLFAILGPQLCDMCDGELRQVVSRGDLDLTESCCLAVAEKKTAALFGACCATGALTVDSEPALCRALQEFGRCFGIAFQVLDDCRDLLVDRERLGKVPGQDLWAGDVTLPLLYALRYGDSRGQRRRAWSRGRGAWALAGICEAFHSSPAPARMAAMIGSYAERAQQALAPLADSDCRRSLSQLADALALSASCLLAIRPIPA